MADFAIIGAIDRVNRPVASVPREPDAGGRTLSGATGNPFAASYLGVMGTASSPKAEVRGKYRPADSSFGLGATAGVGAGRAPDTADEGAGAGEGAGTQDGAGGAGGAGCAETEAASSHDGVPESEESGSPRSAKGSLKQQEAAVEKADKAGVASGLRKLKSAKIVLDASEALDMGGGKQAVEREKRDAELRGERASQFSAKGRALITTKNRNDFYNSYSHMQAPLDPETVDAALLTLPIALANVTPTMTRRRLGGVRTAADAYAARQLESGTLEAELATVTPRRAYLGSMITQSLPPEPMGLTGVASDTIDIRGHGMGDTYIEALSNAFGEPSTRQRGAASPVMLSPGGPRRRRPRDAVGSGTQQASSYGGGGSGGGASPARRGLPVKKLVLRDNRITATGIHSIADVMFGRGGDGGPSRRSSPNSSAEVSPRIAPQLTLRDSLECLDLSNNCLGDRIYARGGHVHAEGAVLGGAVAGALLPARLASQLSGGGGGGAGGGERLLAPDEVGEMDEEEMAEFAWHLDGWGGTEALEKRQKEEEMDDDEGDDAPGWGGVEDGGGGGGGGDDDGAGDGDGDGDGDAASSSAAAATSIPVDADPSRSIVGLFFTNLASRCSRLKRLSLAGNNLDDRHIKSLCAGLRSNASVVHLDIERNRVSEHGARYLGRVLRHNVVLLELLVSWNMFRARGGLAIAYGLRNNDVLENLSMAWNSLGGAGRSAGIGDGGEGGDGSGRYGGADDGVDEEEEKEELAFLDDERSFLEVLGEVLGNENRTLHHVNLGFNKFTEAQCRAFSEQLVSGNEYELNQTLTAVHLEGNCARIRSCGFIPEIRGAPENDDMRGTGVEDSDSKMLTECDSCGRAMHASATPTIYVPPVEGEEEGNDDDGGDSASGQEERGEKVQEEKKSGGDEHTGMQQASGVRGEQMRRSLHPLCWEHAGTFTRYIGYPEIDDHNVWHHAEECWICERWVPFTAMWSPGVSGPALESCQKLSLSLSCLDWQVEIPLTYKWSNMASNAKASAGTSLISKRMAAASKAAFKLAGRVALKRAQKWTYGSAHAVPKVAPIVFGQKNDEKERKKVLAEKGAKRENVGWEESLLAMSPLVTTVMIPPGRTWYCFTTGETPMFAADKPAEHAPRLRYWRDRHILETCKHPAPCALLNYVDSCPRNTPLEGRKAEVEPFMPMPKLWSTAVSIFSDLDPFTEVDRTALFLAAYNQSGIPVLLGQPWPPGSAAVKKEREMWPFVEGPKIKAIFLKSFLVLYETFRLHAAIGPQGPCAFNLSRNMFVALMTRALVHGRPLAEREGGDDASLGGRSFEEQEKYRLDLILGAFYDTRGWVIMNNKALQEAAKAAAKIRAKERGATTTAVGKAAAAAAAATAPVVRTPGVCRWSRDISAERRATLAAEATYPKNKVDLANARALGYTSVTPWAPAVVILEEGGGAANEKGGEAEEKEWRPKAAKYVDDSDNDDDIEANDEDLDVSFGVFMQAVLRTAEAVYCVADGAHTKPECATPAEALERFVLDCMLPTAITLNTRNFTSSCLLQPDIDTEIKERLVGLGCLFMSRAFQGMTGDRMPQLTAVSASEQSLLSMRHGGHMCMSLVGFIEMCRSVDLVGSAFDEMHAQAAFTEFATHRVEGAEGGVVSDPPHFASFVEFLCALVRIADMLDEHKHGQMSSHWAKAWNEFRGLQGDKFQGASLKGVRAASMQAAQKKARFRKSTSPSLRRLSTINQSFSKNFTERLHREAEAAREREAGKTAALRLALGSRKLVETDNGLAQLLSTLEALPAAVVGKQKKEKTKLEGREISRQKSRKLSTISDLDPTPAKTAAGHTDQVRVDLVSLRWWNRLNRVATSSKFGHAVIPHPRLKKKDGDEDGKTGPVNAEEDDEDDDDDDADDADDATNLLGMGGGELLGGAITSKGVFARTKQRKKKTATGGHITRIKHALSQFRWHGGDLGGKPKGLLPAFRGAWLAQNHLVNKLRVMLDTILNKYPDAQTFGLGHGWDVPESAELGHDDKAAESTSEVVNGSGMGGGMGSGMGTSEGKAGESVDPEDEAAVIAAAAAAAAAAASRAASAASAASAAEAASAAAEALAVAALSAKESVELIEQMLRDNHSRVMNLVRQLDTDHDGGLSVRELRKGLTQLGICLSELQLRQFVDRVDDSHDGLVSKAELEKAIHELQAQRRESQVGV